MNLVVFCVYKTWKGVRLLKKEVGRLASKARKERHLWKSHVKEEDGSEEEITKKL